MKILLIHQAFVSPGEAGGTRHFEFAKNLQANGHQMTVVASNISYLTGKPIIPHGGLMSTQRVEGVRVLRAYTYSALHRSFVWRVFAFLSFMVSSIFVGLRSGPVDLVMGTSPPIFQAISAWLVAMIRRKPFLLEIRDLWPEFAIDMGVLKNPVLIWLSRLLEKFLYGQADHILVNSPAYRDYLLEKGISDPKVTLVANGVDTTMFDPHSRGKSVRRRYALDGKFVVTYAGALGLANDIPAILGAADDLRKREDILFLLVGDGKERVGLESKARKRNLTNVLFVGAQPKSAMRELLAASDACLATLMDIPMFSMTYPNKVFDYMAAGRPTILGIDGVIRKVIETCHGGVFVRPSRSHELAATVKRLADNPHEAAAMGQRARLYVEKHFNRNLQSEAFLRLAMRVAYVRTRLQER